MAYLTTLVCWAHLPTAWAGGLDEEGSWRWDAAAREGFEAAPAGLVVTSLQGVTGDPRPLLDEDPGALEGEAVLSLGGERAATVYIPIHDMAPDLVGRRVLLSLWYQPRGTDLLAYVSWRSGDRADALRGGASTGIGQLEMAPTGRVTSDGWVELATSPVDFSIGGVIPASFLVLRDRRFAGGIGRTGPLVDPSDVVVVDALELHDLGPAAVPDAACTALDEDLACGDHGTCLMGRCADAAALWGAPPAAASRASWVERLIMSYAHLGAARATRDVFTQLAAAWRLATAESARDLWRATYAQLEATRDPHARPPLHTLLHKVYGGSGVCLGPGSADLLPGADPTSPAPMVFRTRSSTDNALTRDLQPGDVLTLIDGVAWDQWLTEASVYTYYSGDPTDAPLLRMRRLMDAAATTGATLTFERCALDRPCAPAEVTTLTFDLSTLHHELWDDEALVGNIQAPWCDWRFSTATNHADGDVGLDRFSSALEAGVRHVVFDGFPSRGSQPGWDAGEAEAFASAPLGFVLDMRTGLGGNLEATQDFIAHFFAPDTAARAHLYPWMGEPLDDATRDKFEACTQGNALCSYYLLLDPSLGEDTPRYPDVPVAIVSGSDVSGSDFALYMLRHARATAPTRIFGYANSHGGFGQSCPQERLFGEAAPFELQCSDAQVVHDDGTRTGFLTGTGVAPDERIYQRQSDALAGVDTALEAAKAWMTTQLDEGGM
jgi:hypothetical protein